MTMQVPHQSEIVQSDSAPSIRWLPATIIVLVGAVVFAIVRYTDFAFTGRPTIDLVVVVGASGTALFTWLLYGSRISPVGRVRGLVVVSVLVACGTLSFSVDGYTGDGRPMLTFRWRTSPKQALLYGSARQNTSRNGELLPIGTQSDVSVRDATQFRGPDRSGVMDDVGLARDWQTASPELVWRRDIGQGWSSFSLVGDSCFTQEQRGVDECTVCYELRTGRERWAHHDQARFQEMMGGDGPRATPTINSGQVYALGATGILNCLDADSGNRIWTRNILDDAAVGNSLFGMAGSPLLTGELVVVSPGGPDYSLAAYRRDDGEIAWHAGSAKAAYSSPMLATLGGIRQVLIFNADGLFAHHVGTGKVLWSFPWVTPPEWNNVCQPIILPGDNRNTSSETATNRVFIASGYNKGCGVLEIVRTNGEFSVRPVWTNRNLRPKFSSVVLHDGFAYGLDEKYLVCVDTRTGERRWKGGRYGFGQVLLAGDLILVQAESGEIALVTATPDRHEELRRFPALRDRTWNHPILAGGLLLVRNDREAACYALPMVD